MFFVFYVAPVILQGLPSKTVPMFGPSMASPFGGSQPYLKWWHHHVLLWLWIMCKRDLTSSDSSMTEQTEYPTLRQVNFDHTESRDGFFCAVPGMAPLFWAGRVGGAFSKGLTGTADFPFCHLPVLGAQANVFLAECLAN